MNQRVTILAILALTATACANAPVSPAYQVALPNCAADTVRVCDNFGHARSARGCSCVRQSDLFLE